MHTPSRNASIYSMETNKTDLEHKMEATEVFFYLNWLFHWNLRFWLNINIKLFSDHQRYFTCRKFRKSFFFSSGNKNIMPSNMTHSQTKLSISCPINLVLSWLLSHKITATCYLAGIQPDKKKVQGSSYWVIWQVCSEQGEEQVKNKGIQLYTQLLIIYYIMSGISALQQ